MTGRYGTPASGNQLDIRVEPITVDLILDQEGRRVVSDLNSEVDRRDSIRFQEQFPPVADAGESTDKSDLSRVRLMRNGAAYTVDLEQALEDSDLSRNRLIQKSGFIYLKLIEIGKIFATVSIGHGTGSAGSKAIELARSEAILASALIGRGWCCSGRTAPLQTDT